MPDKIIWHDIDNIQVDCSINLKPTLFFFFYIANERRPVRSLQTKNKFFIDSNSPLMIYKCNKCYTLNATTATRDFVTSNNSDKWLILIHQIPPKPNAFRVKIWRRLQQIGAVAIKQSVYAMPFSEASKEDLNWVLKEITSGGGDGSVFEAKLLEGLTDEQVITLFRNARRSDYEKIAGDAGLLLTEWSAGDIDPSEPSIKGYAQVSKFRKRLDDVAAIDFFKTPERYHAENMINRLTDILSGQKKDVHHDDDLTALKGKTWVTRNDLFIDRIACGWLIKRFIDTDARFLFVESDAYSPGSGEIRFDMYDGDYTHEGDQCSFEVMIKRLQLQHPGLNLLAEIIHDIDLKDSKYGRAEAAGFSAVLNGLVLHLTDDYQRMTAGYELMEHLLISLKNK